MKKGVDFIGVGVGAIILNDEGKVFLAKRGHKAKNERGTWEFPGGGVEFGEKLVDAISTPNSSLISRLIASPNSQ
jgi:ADP-ribose pyrophosphatase YjhB (NUDIX family)